jgi:hypothetical protein
MPSKDFTVVIAEIQGIRIATRPNSYATERIENTPENATTGWMNRNSIYDWGEFPSRSARKLVV